MSNQLWSWMLAAVGILGIYLAGRKKAAGWAVGVAAQALWLAYAIATRQWGFVATAIAYAAVYGKNWMDWRGVDLTRVRFIPPPKVGRWRIVASTPTSVHDVGRYRTFIVAHWIARSLSRRDVTGRTRYVAEPAYLRNTDNRSYPRSGGGDQ